MNKQLSDQQRYERLIYDGARDLAVAYRGRPEEMAGLLKRAAVPVEMARSVLDAMNSPDYMETMYRGEMVDEGVVESLKECLRWLHLGPEEEEE